MKEKFLQSIDCVKYIYLLNGIFLKLKIHKRCMRSLASIQHHAGERKFGKTESCPELQC